MVVAVAANANDDAYPVPEFRAGVLDADGLAHGQRTKRMGVLVVVGLGSGFEGGLAVSGLHGQGPAWLE